MEFGDSSDGAPWSAAERGAPPPRGPGPSFMDPGASGMVTQERQPPYFGSSGKAQGARNGRRGEMRGAGRALRHNGSARGRPPRSRRGRARGPRAVSRLVMVAVHSTRANGGWGFRPRTGGDGRGGGKAGAGDLLVEERGEEEKLGVLEGKSVAPLVDAALAQDDRLAAGAEGVADDGPFFEGNAHGRDFDSAFPARGRPDSQPADSSFQNSTEACCHIAAAWLGTSICTAIRFSPAMG